MLINFPCPNNPLRWDRFMSGKISINFIYPSIWILFCFRVGLLRWFNFHFVFVQIHRIKPMIKKAAKQIITNENGSPPNLQYANMENENILLSFHNRVYVVHLVHQVDCLFSSVFVRVNPWLNFSAFFVLSRP
jgi:hypothetical protein